MKQESTIDPHKFQEKYDEAINRNDAPSVGKLFTDDAIFVTDAGPVYGRQAIEKWYADMFQQFHPNDFKGKPDQNSPYAVGETGNEAWRIGEWSQRHADNIDEDGCGAVGALDVTLQNIDVKRKILAFDFWALQDDDRVSYATAITLKDGYRRVRRILREIVAARPPILYDAAGEFVTG